MCLVCLTFTFEFTRRPIPAIQSPSSMDIAKVNPHELAPFVGSLGVGVMDSMAFSLSSRSNSTIDKNQISFGTVGFLTTPTHPSFGLRKSRPGDGYDVWKTQVCW
jgi:hypothetical protein